LLKKAEKARESEPQDIVETAKAREEAEKAHETKHKRRLIHLLDDN